jgi:hypothetical protein
MLALMLLGAEQPHFFRTTPHNQNFVIAVSNVKV